VEPHNAAMHPIAIGFAVVAALIHAYSFVLESAWFMRPAVYGRFGLRSEEDARIVRSFAFNQGFYNLFLTAGVIVGLAFLAMGDVASGRAVALFACSSMVAAGIVLAVHDRTFARAAAIQALPPLLAIAAALLLG
jgi:putative membrane protein